MKLCNHRFKRSQEGRCWLKCDDIRPPSRKRNWAAPVFQPDGSGDYLKWSPEQPQICLPRYECTKQMAEICPYRVHSARPPQKPTKWYDCPNCGHRHRTEQARLLCAGYTAWHKAFAEFKRTFAATGFNPEGTTEEIYPDELIKFPSFQNVRAHLWPVMMNAINHRDKHRCQDCGNDTSPVEVHHIIPRGMGGSDHPANLKLVCQNCHRKYNEKFNGEIISRKAQERKTAKVKSQMPKSLEEFA